MASYSEVMKSLDKFRGHKKTSKPLTKQQIEFLKKCREHENPVPYLDMTKLWKDLGWGDYSASAIRLKYKQLQDR